ncbi:hypothetical protein SCB49_01127 [unidentified eubacterium SCB49]|nr:hypothetical protein SCB49_01127 [unidentified eubacterium SCB49]
MNFNTKIFTKIERITKLMLFVGLFLVTSQSQTWAQNKVLVNNATVLSPDNRYISIANYGPTVDNPNNALLVDNNYATLYAQGGIEVLGIEIGGYEGVIELEFPSDVPKDTWSYVRMDDDTGLLDGLLGGSLGDLLTGLLDNLLLGNQEIVIDARDGTTSVLSRSSESGFNTPRVKVIQDAAGHNYLAIRPDAKYDRLRITHKKSATLDLGGEKELKIYSAFYFDGTGEECGRPFGTSFDGDDGIGLSLIEVGDQNLNYAIDNDVNTFSTLKPGSLVDVNIASTLRQNFYFSTPSNIDNTLNIKIALGSAGVVNANLLGAIQVVLYDEDANIVYTRALQSSLLNNTDALGLLTSGAPITLTFAPGISYSSAAVELVSPIGAAVLGSGIKIYDVQRYDGTSTCINLQIAAIPSATISPLDTPSCASTLLDFENVDFPSYAVDGNNETYAVLNADSGNLLTSGASIGYVQMDLGNVGADQITYARINYDEDILDRLAGGSIGMLVSDLANGLLLGDQYIEVEAFNGSTSVLNLTSQDAFGGPDGDTTGNVTVVQDNIGRFYLAIKPSTAYTNIKITNHVTALLPTGKQSALHVYDACFDIGVDPCFEANFTAPRAGGLSLSVGDLDNAGVTDPYKAISENSSDFSTINLGVAGVAAWVYQSVYFTQPSQTGDHVKVRLAIGTSQLVDVDLIGTYAIKFYNGNSLVDTFTLSSGLINSLDLLTLIQTGGSVTLDYVPTGIFDRVDVGIESLVSVGVESPSMRLYEVTRYNESSCPIVITDSPFQESSCLSKIVASENADEVANLLDDDFDSYATLNSEGAALWDGSDYEGFVEMGYDQDVAAGVTSYIRVDFEEDILEGLTSGSLGNVVSTLLDGLLVNVLLLENHYFTVDIKHNTYNTSGDVTASTIIATASSKDASAGGNNMIRVVQDAAGRYYIAVTPDQAYNAVRITDTTDSSVVLPIDFIKDGPNSMNVYGMCTELLSTERCIDAFATSYEMSGLNISVDAVGTAGVTNMERAIDGNTTNYSEISNGTLGIGTSTKQWIFFTTISNDTDSVLVKLDVDGAVVNANVLDDGLEIKAYLGNVEVAVLDFSATGLLNGVDVVDLLNGVGAVELNFKPGVSFDRISVGTKYSVLNASVFPPIRLFSVSRVCGSGLMITNPMIYQKVD